jgi:hypothetical protein
MEGNFDYLINNLDIYLQPYEWILYHDLIETKNNLESINFYEWEFIKDNIKYQEIKLLLNDFENNIVKIIDIVKDIMIENIKNDNRFTYVDDDHIKVKWWHLKSLVKCENCGNIWDGFAQCTCWMDDY